MVELASAPERIAVIQTGHLGEVVLVAPLVRVLKLAWPKSHLTLVTRPQLAALGAWVPGVDAVVRFDKNGEDSGLAGLKRVAKALGGPQLVLAPHGSLRSAMLTWLTNAETRVGCDLPVKRRFFNVKVPVRAREPLVERAMDLARALGVEGPTDLQLAPAEAELSKARAALGEPASVGLVLGADWATKRWPIESWVGLAARAGEAGLRPVILGGAEDRPLADALLAAAKGPVLDLVGKTVLETVAAMALMRGVVGGDAGIVHAARAVGTPTLLLFGPTDPGAHALEYYAQALRLGLDCQPCDLRAAKGCPLKHLDCLNKLEVDRTWSAFSNLLGRGGRR